MNYDFSSAVKAKDSGKFLSAGIKNATFEGVEYTSGVSQSTGNPYTALSLKLNVEDYGEYTQNFFEPTSSERQEMQWGPTPSQLDHFLIIVREILEALDPQIIADIDEGKTKLTGNFAQVVKIVKNLTAPYIGNQVQVKFIPQNNGYVSMPSFPARLTKNGDLGISTRIIGHNLTMTAAELKRIEAAKNAAPTNMASKIDAKKTLDEMDKDLGDNSSEDDEMPF